MSYVLTYQEPNRLSAGLLALTVHAAFFALLIFGLRWQTLPPENFAVELWDSLPAIKPIPEQPPSPPPESIPQPVVTSVPPQPVMAAPPQPIKAEIELREKKASKAVPAKPSAEELKARRQAEAEAEEKRLLEEYAEQRRQSEQARVRAEVSAATAAEMRRYEDMIRSKIRRNIVMPPDVAVSVTSEFKVTLLPGGMVMDVVLLKSSGNPAYDNAAERAIYKAQPLPIPADAGLQKMFRELRLTIRP